MRMSSEKKVSAWSATRRRLIVEGIRRMEKEGGVKLRGARGKCEGNNRKWQTIDAISEK